MIRRLTGYVASFLAVGVAIISSAAAQHAVGRCLAQSTEPEAAIICGRGRAALTVVPGTQSPDDKFAIAWREGRKTSDRDWVDGYLVRQSDGALLSKISGKFAGAEGQLYSHEYVSAYWNLEASVVAVFISQKWETRSLHIYSRRHDGKIIHHGEHFGKIEKAVQRLLKRKRPKLRHYEYTTTLQPGVVVRHGEAIHAIAMLQVPKSDDAPIVEFKIVLDVSQNSAELREPIR